ncbi:Thiol:disulfide interchange protein DsbA precursor [Legionella massiliensis]|uniref:Thiol:disulfide interchange protein n=1 Tax=Legionella massiliensis TaxID=1034943 RepID=A0A078KSV7_9GAMM|nr:thiol:disulfide interchange protein DsbA/DsbL [Legionella massiliensis]CDZ76032.1 Thiol:disulfide interchange protein DsbA precursor [Legionella massiliensis]CEE11770.1 Thiol:disulfide interchange protein DsbA precursor [Legionella massiliensis]
MLRRLVSIILLVLPLIATAEDFVAGKDYELISSSSATTAEKGKVSVLEFFSYGCPWCYKIEPTLMDWVKKQGDNIQFSRVPVVFHKDWVYYAKAYYTAKLLNLDSKFNPLLFKAVQAKNGPTMSSNEAMINFFVAQGVDPATAKSAFENSTTVDMQVTQGLALMSQDHINGVPALVVNNQYKTDLQMAKDINRLLQILDFLVAKAKEKN